MLPAMSDPTPNPPARTPRQSFQAPTGTRDLYPVELARRRWIEDKWRKVAVRHGFEEIDGPTFESSDLYAVKSGDGILNELFQTFSGKDPEQAKQAGEGRSPYALRPEFTPTLARMYAARAGNLPKPSKWFWQGPCFRAEKPQRGRLREFWQWNCDVVGGSFTSADTESAERAQLDAEVLGSCVALLEACGLRPEQARVRWGSRQLLLALSEKAGVLAQELDGWLLFLDRSTKLDVAKQAQLAESMKIRTEVRAEWDRLGHEVAAKRDLGVGGLSGSSIERTYVATQSAIRAGGLEAWCDFDLSVVRGLAYYTGMVFEVIVDGERAVAGGGRYDNLIELFGGPPTPACGFGMGDVVLSLVLQDKGLMPSDKQIARELGLRPDVFVISNGSPESDAAVTPTLAGLRRAGLHARRSYKASKNIGKLLKDASDQGSQYAIIIEDAGEVTIKDLDQNKQRDGRVKLDELVKNPKIVLPPPPPGGLG
jgi:histidyl-tRNA synthetase